VLLKLNIGNKILFYCEERFYRFQKL
jgi:hypothetical protein